ncbi:MAG: sigma-70 family RNA polymerase sigma factor [Acidimicrobiales bacterium]|nr:sigma-70 family RNA polymerase sigma factor [Acidimicrobiales bacterium]
MEEPGDAGPHDEARAADRGEDERLVLALRAGDPDAFGRLYDRWFDRVHDLARRVTRDDGLAADVAQDAFLAAWQRVDRLDDPAAFGGWLLRIARNRALDVVRSAGHRRTEAVAEVTDERAAADRVQNGSDPVLVAEDREVQSLVWGAAEALGERDLTALDLHLRHGLEPAEIGDVLGINRNAANQLVHRMRGRLSTAVACRVLWQGGRPRCERLRRELAAEGVTSFDARTVRVTDRHAAACDACTRRRELRLDPTKLFAALPIPVVALGVKQQAAAALAGAGVPMGGSTSVGAEASAAVTPDGPGPSDGGPGGPAERGPADAGRSEGTGAGSEGGASPGGPGVADRHARRSRRRTATLVALGVVAILAVLVLGVEALDDGGLGDSQTVADRPEPSATTSTTLGEGTMVLTPLPGADEPPAGPDVSDEVTDVVVDPGSGGAAPPPGPADPPVVTVPPPPPAPEGALSASPSRVGTVHPNGQVVVSWSSSGATTISVSGPGLSSSSPAGSQGVCPGTVVSSVCRASAGTYTYVLTATGPGGTVERTATVTVA